MTLKSSGGMPLGLLSPFERVLFKFLMLFKAIDSHVRHVLKVVCHVSALLASRM
jgi:hypothetical protein